MYRLAALHSHPIQYFAPFYRRLAHSPEIDLTVYYCSRQGVDAYTDAEFGQRLGWDIPLLEGYRHVFLPNLAQPLLQRGGEVAGFFSLINPSIIDQLRRHRPDALLIYGHQFITYLVAFGAAKLMGIPVLMRCDTHLLLRKSSAKMRIRRLVMTLFYKLCDICLPVGTRNAEFYRHHGVSEKRLFLVPFAVDNDFFAAASAPFQQDTDNRKQLGLPVDRPLILFASKLTPRKRPMDLLRAYHHLCQQDIQAALLFIGSGSEEEALKSYVKQHNLPGIFFLGFRNQSELPRYYAAADIFVLPSENEPWGLIINEVMCAGLPVVASKEIGAVPDLVIDGFNGLIFDAGDIHQLALHLKTLATNTALRQELGSHSRQRIGEWNYELGVNGILAALRELRARH